ncbi:ATP-binding cassette sub-family B member 10, mitochondrial [Diaphorina citri]|jgi:ABC-type multidrug transport system, ATPase and permease components|uniref:ATP-binding cassette sub-family B member 10, mitochondrial n=1 Tax=Diaphorina citri TaxID=121845 RepID=A0A1S3D473_DIACI|nr:ATP-binding cassette sub-family B member 10, mitochondrial [Diaphorina citri]QAA95905.1 ATP-binding cassette sub-family B member 5 [Diaphorina citri]QER78488.1 ATP-binding cassette transporter [Diaphorina citri]
MALYCCHLSKKIYKNLFFNKSLAFKIISHKPFSKWKLQNNEKIISRYYTSTPNNQKVGTKIKKSELKKLFTLAKSEKRKLTGAVCLLLVSSSITMAVPFALGKVIDVIYTSDKKEMKEKMTSLSLLLMLVFVVGACCNFGRVYLMNVSAQSITKKLRERLFGSIISQETAYFDKHKTGELINRISADTSLVSQCVTQNISDGLRSTVMVSAGVSMMFIISSKLALISLIIVPPVAGLAIVYGKFVRKITRNVQDKLANAVQVAEERISNIRTVKSFSQEKLEMSHFNAKMDDLFELAKKEALAKGVFFGFTGLSGNAIILSVLYYGGVMVSYETITVGNLSSFLLYAAYIGISIGGLSNFYSELNKGLGACHRLWEIMEREPLISTSGGKFFSHSLKGEIDFNNIRFSYPSRPDAVILNDLSLKIQSGSMTSVIGSSGSGKSTLAMLLLRLYDPQNGKILIDGVDIKELDPMYLRSQIGSVSQEPTLFSGTIYENILYGVNDSSSVTKSDIIHAAKEANAYGFVIDFKNGFDTIVGERGIMLSGGQKQRIAIARALIKKSKILLLDEATSALDAENEYLVQSAIEKLIEGKTVLTIAHRLSTIRKSNQICVLDKGKIVEIGSYAHLIKNPNSMFNKLMKYQTMD